MNKVKEWVGYILAPIAFILGFVYYLFTRNGNLREEIARNKAEREMEDKLKEVQDAKTRADSAERDWVKFKSGYKSRRD